MPDSFIRTKMLLGDEAMDRLAKSRVAVFGIGGVGGYVCEALVRSGIGAFDLIDPDKVELTNINQRRCESVCKTSIRTLTFGCIHVVFCRRMRMTFRLQSMIIWSMPSIWLRQKLLWRKRRRHGRFR